MKCAALLPAHVHAAQRLTLGFMIRNPDILAEFERNWIASEPLDYERNLRIADAMLALARDLGQWPRPDPLEGIEKDIELSRMLRRVKGVPQRCTESC